jgi:peroxiredoxin
MLATFRNSTALAALAMALVACSGSETAATEPSPEAASAPVAVETAAATSASEAALASPAPAASVTESTPAAQSATLTQPAPVATPAAAPAPAAAPEEEEQHASMNHAPGITNHSLPIDKIKNFKLTDQNGKSWELYKMTDAKAIVLTMHTKGCPIGQQLMPDFKDLQAKYEAKGVRFLMLNSNTYDTPKMIKEETTSFGSTIPVLKDTDQSVGEPLGVERATETLVIEPGTWKVLFQGPINDRVTYGRARAKADKQYVGGVVDAMLAGKAVTPSFVAPEGCILVFDNRKG